MWIVVLAAAVSTGARADYAPSLTFVDEQGAAHELTAAALGKLPRRTVKVTDKDQKQVEYEGVQLTDVLRHFGVVLGKELRGARVASYVLLEASDGYRVVLAIGEVDPETTDKVVLLADRADGAPLPEKVGPFRIVIPDDKRPVRWIRMLAKISVRNVPVDEVGAARDGEP